MTKTCFISLTRFTSAIRITTRLLKPQKNSWNQLTKIFSLQFFNLQVQRMMTCHLLHQFPPAFPISKPYPKLASKSAISCVHNPNPNNYDYCSEGKNSIWSNNLISLAIAVALITPLPCLAIPSLNSKSFSLPSKTSPFSQARNLPTGLENGYFYFFVFLLLVYILLLWEIGKSII